MGLVATLVLNLTLGLAGYITARGPLRQPPGLPRGLAAAVIAWAWATLGMQGLGSIGQLRYVPLLAWSVAGLVLALIAARLRRPTDLSPATPTADRSRLDGPALAAVGLMAGAVVGLLVRALSLPVQVMSDGPIYHLYFAARWWQAGRLFVVAAPFGESSTAYFPANGDLWFTWLLIGSGDDILARAGQFPFLILAVAAIYGLARLVGAGRSASAIAACWGLGSSPFLVFTFEPNVDTIFVAGYLAAVYFFARHGLNNDLPSMVIGALAAGLTWGTKPSGLVLVPPLLAIVGGFALIGRRSARAKAGRLAILAVVPMFAAGYWYARSAWLTGNPLYPLQVSAFGRVLLDGWHGPEVMRQPPYYLPVDDWRSLVDMLALVFDARLVPIWALALFGAWRWGAPAQPSADREVLTRSHAPRGNVDPDAPRRPTRLRWTRSVRTGIPTQSVGTSEPRFDQLTWALAGLAVMNVALYWFLIPYRTQYRFMFQAVGLAAVPLARLLDRGRGWRWLAVSLLGLHLIAPLGWPWGPGRPLGPIPWDRSPIVPDALPGLFAGSNVLVSVGTFGATLGLAWALRGGRRWVVVAIAVAGAAGVAFLASAAPGPARSPTLRRALRHYAPFPPYFEGWMALERASRPGGERVAYAGMNLPYYLLGVDLRNDVRYVNVEGPADWLLHDYHRRAIADGRPTSPTPRPGWDRERPDLAAWLANLDRERITLLFVARPNPAAPWPIEGDWADARPDRFSLIAAPGAEGGHVRLYRVRPGRL